MAASTVLVLQHLSGNLDLRFCCLTASRDCCCCSRKVQSHALYRYERNVSSIHCRCIFSMVLRSTWCPAEVHERSRGTPDTTGGKLYRGCQNAGRARSCMDQQRERVKAGKAALATCCMTESGHIDMGHCHILDSRTMSCRGVCTGMHLPPREVSTL